MKTLTLIRHAKSSWSDSVLSDIERPLNNRGLRDCELMAYQISKTGLNLKLVYCSPANRALSTAKLLLSECDDIKFEVDELLYTFSVHELHRWVMQLPEELQDVVVIGHNPAITDYCNHFANAQIINLPTCGFVRLKSSAENWQSLSAKNTSVETILFPKMFKS